MVEPEFIPTLDKLRLRRIFQEVIEECQRAEEKLKSIRTQNLEDKMIPGAEASFAVWQKASDCLSR